MISIVVISKDEPAIDDTLTDVAEQARALGEPWEIVVVDASDGRLDEIRQRQAGTTRWIPFRQPPGVRVTIPHQRNAGIAAARGDIIVFTDAGCRPEADWLKHLLAPLGTGQNSTGQKSTEHSTGEHVTAGIAVAKAGDPGLYARAIEQARQTRYLPECPTINLAFHRDVVAAAGDFDERFAYGSDVDFSWRLIKAGYRIRSVPEAVVRHDWGTRRRQLRRSWVYGRARARLYRKHHLSVLNVLRRDPIVVVYPLFLLGLPLTFVFPLYPALLLIPAWRNRADGPVRVLADHLIFGAGVLAELVSR